MRLRSILDLRWPRGLLGMLALVALIERGVADRDGDFTSMEAWGWRIAGRDATSPEVRTSRVLGLGDSTMKLGLAPAVFEAYSGRNAYNLAVPAANAPAEYFVFRRALEAGARPEAIVMAFESHLLTEDRWHAARLWPELASISDVLDLAATARDGGFFGAQVAARLILSFKQRYEIRWRILDNLAGRFVVSPRQVMPRYRRNWEVNRGAMMMPEREGPPESTDDDFPAEVHALFAPKEWSCEAVNRRYIDRILSLAESRSIPVFWVLTPYRPSIQAIREQTGMDDRYTAFVMELQRSHPGLRVIDARSGGFKRQVFLDVVHLNHRGAGQLSAAVGTAVAQALADPAADRWATLRPVESKPVRVAVEDLNRSADILRARWRATHLR